MKLNDYIFDEIQNIDAEMGKFDLKKLIRQQKHVQ